MSSPLFVLTVEKGPGAGKRIGLANGKTYVIGRDPSASLVLSDPRLSGKHATLSVAAGQVILTCADGALIGDRKVSRAQIKLKMRFRIGDTVLSLSQAAGTQKPTDPLVGKIIGGYKVNEVVGQGAMGTVYRATQLSLQREIALKVLSRELAKDTSFVDLFVNEARSAAQLVHPNVVQVYDAGTEGDLSFFSMEFIGQGSVEEVLQRKRRIPWEEAILMVLEAAHGLEYAEGKGIVHRDIKPDNLMINDDGRVKLADLGLAKRGERKEDTGIIGTPHFIPPEQATGKEVDSRADIYSLGATFFRVITGKTVFTGKTAREIVVKHIKEPPPAASSIDSSIPDEIDGVLARMLAKDPDQRYQTAAELITALETVCAHHGIKGAIIRKGVGKRVLIPVVALLLAAVGVAIHFATQEAEKYEDPETIAARKHAEAEAAKARKERAEAARGDRRSTAKARWAELRGDYYQEESTNPLKGVYDREGQEAANERPWSQLAAEFETFSRSELAEEFDSELKFSTQARDRAKEIRETLRKGKASAEDKRKWIKDSVAEATRIAGKLRIELGALLQRRKYGEAHAVSSRHSRQRPLKTDPFRKIEGDVWTSPVDRGLKVKATEVKAITVVIARSREYFQEELKLVVGKAKADWEAVRQALPDPDSAPDADLEAASRTLQAVEGSFGSAPREIGEITAEARRRRTAFERTLETRQQERVARDRRIVRNKLRRLRSLEPMAASNAVMNCQFGAAMDEWTQLMEEVQTKRYKAFVAERIVALRWVDYLFWRFHADVKISLEDKSNAPLVNLKSEFPTVGGRVHRFRFYKPTTNVYEFVIRPRLRGKEDTLLFAHYSMDWIYSHCFQTPEGRSRWKEMTPVLEFAHGVFCFETMRYKASLKHFEKLFGDERYGAAARDLARRAKVEAAARSEYEAILQEYDQATETGTAEQVTQILQRLRNFDRVHEGTLFHIEVMSSHNTLSRDFAGAAGSVPAIPKAPPRPQ